MSFAGSNSIADIAEDTSEVSTTMTTRTKPFGLESASITLLPTVIGYFSLALLVCLPHETRLVRRCLCIPVVLLACWTAVVLDVPASFNDERMSWINQGLVVRQ